VLAVIVAAAATGTATATPPRAVEVVVVLGAPSLARARTSSRVLTAAERSNRLELDSPTSEAYLTTLEQAQDAMATRIRGTIQGAVVRWRYRIVLNGLAVVLPENRVDELMRIPGVARVYDSVRYTSLLDRTPQLIGAPALWGPDLSTAGNGMKIGIIDDGLDQSHPFFSATGLAMPAGFPKGQTSFTTAKVIAARAFPPPRPAWRHAAKPFDPDESVHATHVAGIAAGNNGVTVPGRGPVSGIAPRAYLGNYKVLTIPTASGVGLDGNAPEIAAGIEAAVADGMDVINLSLGEPEIEPTRDLVVQAIDAAADAGVVPVLAAGNDFSEMGFGSVGSPGVAAKAITVAATTKGREMAGFSAGGPTPISLRMKPDVSAPGAAVVSSVPEDEGGWASFSGTSMASPHVAGAAALLLQRHPAWTPAQVKSALSLTATSVADRIAPTRQGAGLITLPSADAPLIFAAPTGISFGHLTAPGETVTRSIELADAGGGAGAWNVRVLEHARGALAVTAAASVAVPGTLALTATAGTPTGASSAGEGWIVLARNGQERRIPYWGLVAPVRLGPPSRTLTRSGTYGGNTRGQPARVSSYRYPEDPSGAGITTRLDGPEQVFRVRLTRAVANFGVAITGRASSVRVEARTVQAGNEYRQTGYASLPINLNPYLATFLRPRLVSGALRPAPGTYDIVFDSPSAEDAGRFTFRFWIDDVTPPAVRLVTRAARSGAAVRIAITDTGAGVDPESLVVAIDGSPRRASFRRGVVSVSSAGLALRNHRLVVQVSDYQETRNNENVPRILPNTRVFRATFRLR
jgi:subtilisin family serine protease